MDSTLPIRHPWPLTVIGDPIILAAKINEPAPSCYLVIVDRNPENEPNCFTYRYAIYTVNAKGQHLNHDDIIGAGTDYASIMWAYTRFIDELKELTIRAL